jgi:hypothetical protein
MPADSPDSHGRPEPIRAQPGVGGQPRASITAPRVKLYVAEAL